MVDVWCVYVIQFIIINFIFRIFSSLIAIFAGKMFKSVDLPWLITFFQMFYNDKPVDWLLGHLIDTKVCNWEKDAVSMVDGSAASPTAAVHTIK